MDKSAIKNFSIEARKVLMRSAETEAGFYGVTRNGCKNPIQKGNDFEVYETLAGTENRIFGADIKKRANLVEAVETLGFDQVIEETAYTWFNRIIAIRFMEVNGYLPTRVRVLSSETGSNTPDIVTQSLDVDLNMTPVELEKVQKAKDENRYDEAFRMLFVKQCNELNAILPGLFEKTDDYMELLLKLSYTSDGVVRMLVDMIAEDNFNVETEGQVEIIGWMYQYYNTELKDDTFAKLKKNVKITRERIPSATQLFTPDWIVRYMVENSVGRVWIEHLRALDASIDENAKAEEFGWKYYVPEAEQDENVQQQLIVVRKSYKDLTPMDITCIDPCMGSGHILVYMFDVLMDIYTSEGYNERNSVFDIIEKNIRGLDIDRRAYQLSYFALMMKARGYNRSFFRGKVEIDGERIIVNPMIFAIEDSNSINRKQLKYFGVGLESGEKEYGEKQLVSLLNSLQDAKEYGSILNIDECNWKLLKSFISVYDIGGQISFDTIGIENTQSKIVNIINQAKAMSSKYYVVSTNPPYMGLSNGSGKMNNYAKLNYPDSCTDLFAVFIEKCSKMLLKDGYMAMITQHSWMFISIYEKLRRLELRYNIINMLHLGARAFEEIGGEVVQTVSWIQRNCNVRKYIATYERLICGMTQKEKERLFLTRSNKYFAINQEFERIPGTPFAYWINKNVLNNYENSLLKNYVNCRSGIMTGSDKYILLWFEPDIKKIKFNCNSEKDMGEYKWFPMNSGGEFRYYYGNNSKVVDLWKDGINIKNNVKNYRLRDKELYFKEGITWGRIATKKIAFRDVEKGTLFGDAGPVGFINKNRRYVLGFLCSKVALYFLEATNPTMNFQVRDIENLPLIIDESKIDLIEDLVGENILIERNDWDSMETSWNFIANPLVQEGKFMHKIEDCYIELKNKNNRIKSQFIENQQKINQLFIDIYNLETELTKEIDEEDVTLRKFDKKKCVKDLVSYGVGCIFGRYSIDNGGIIYAGGEWNDVKYCTFKPDLDGIIPIIDEDYFKDDIVSKFVDFIQVVYGEDYLEENLMYIATALGNKGNTSREMIRNYFITAFIKDHCNMYSITGSGKRPIYWLFDSGKENGFKCLIYMHRYTKDTLNLIRSEYLHKTQDAIENALKNVEYIIQTSSSAVEKAKATKDRDKYVKQLNEMRIYYQALSHLAIQKIEIDLDNGVKNNYQLFQDIEVIADGGKKQKVDLLAKI